MKKSDDDIARDATRWIGRKANQAVLVKRFVSPDQFQAVEKSVIVLALAQQNSWRKLRGV